MKNKILQIGSLVSLMGVSTMAFAAQDESLVDTVMNLIDFMFVLKLLAIAAFYCAGIWYGGGGLISLVKSLKQNSQENPVQAAGKFVGGCVLLILPTVLGLTANLFSEGSGQTLQEGITTEGQQF